jgi:hypothetical protein
LTVKFGEVSNILPSGGILYENQFLISSNGRYKAILNTNALFLVIVIFIDQNLKKVNQVPLKDEIPSRIL